MKLFTELRQMKSPKGGEVVYKKKHGKYPVSITKTNKGYTAMIDGDVLDTFRSEKDAMKGIEMAIKAIG